MTYKQFCIWLAGYMAGIEGPPTRKQWEAIEAKLLDVVAGGFENQTMYIQPNTPVYMDGVFPPPDIHNTCDSDS